MALADFFSKSRQDLRVVIDIGPGFIRAVIFELIPQKKNPSILKKMVLRLAPSITAPRAIAKFREFLFLAIKELGRVPEKIVLSVAPPFAEYALENVAVEPSKTPLINSRRDLDEYFQKFFAGKDVLRRTLFAYPLEFFVNKYPIDPSVLIHPENITINELGFSALLTYLPQEAGEFMEEAKESLGSLSLGFIPLVVAEKEAIQKNLGLKDVFLVDLGRDATVLSLIKEGGLARVSLFPVGLNHFLEDVAKKSSLTPEEAGDFARQYAKGLLGDSQKIKLENSFMQIADIWKKAFLQEVDSFYHGGNIPPNIALFGEGAYVPEISVILRDSNWIRNVSYAATPQVKILSGNSFFEGDSLGGALQGPEDTGLASLIIYSMDQK
mgnify:CR=1 FL=1